MENWAIIMQFAVICFVLLAHERLDFTYAELKLIMLKE